MSDPDESWDRCWAVACVILPEMLFVIEKPKRRHACTMISQG